MSVIIIKIISLLISLFPHRFVVNFPSRIIRFLKLIDRKTYTIFYKNHEKIGLTKSKSELQRLATSSLISNYQNILISLKYLVRNNFNIKKDVFVNIQNDEFVNIYGKRPIIHITIHIGPNVLIPNLYSKVIKVPFCVPVRGEKKDSIVKLICNSFSTENLKIVTLGGASRYVEDILSKKGIVLLALDAILPVKHKTSVKLFNFNFEMANGVIWLAEKYNAVVIPAVASFNANHELQYDMYPTLKFTHEDKMQEIANAIQSLIVKYESKWNIADEIYKELT